MTRIWIWLLYSSGVFLIGTGISLANNSPTPAVITMGIGLVAGSIVEAVREATR